MLGVDVRRSIAAVRRGEVWPSTSGLPTRASARSRRGPHPLWPPLAAAIGLALAACSSAPSAGGPSGAVGQVLPPPTAAPSPTGEPRAAPPTPTAVAPPPTPTAAPASSVKVASHAEAPGAAAGAARPAAEGPAPDFTARLLGGGSFALSQQQGKPVLVLFTASWCLSCIPEVDKMARLQDEYGPKGLEQLVLSVEADDSEADFADLRRRTKGTNLFWGLDPGQKATLAYKVLATDTKVLIDRRGQIVFRSVGPTPFETLRQQVAAVVG